MKKFLLCSAGALAALFISGCSNLPVPEQPEGKRIPINTDIILSKDVLSDSAKTKKAPEKPVKTEEKADRIPSIQIIDKSDVRFTEFRKPRSWPKAAPAPASKSAQAAAPAKPAAKAVPNPTPAVKEK